MFGTNVIVSGPKFGRGDYVQDTKGNVGRVILATDLGYTVKFSDSVGSRFQGELTEVEPNGFGGWC